LIADYFRAIVIWAWDYENIGFLDMNFDIFNKTWDAKLVMTRERVLQRLRGVKNCADLAGRGMG
jgi:hypothetical protein